MRVISDFPLFMCMYHEGDIMSLNSQVPFHLWQPFESIDEIWSTLDEMKNMSDGEEIDLWNHQMQR